MLCELPVSNTASTPVQACPHYISGEIVQEVRRLQHQDAPTIPRTSVRSLKHFELDYSDLFPNFRGECQPDLAHRLVHPLSDCNPI